VNCKPDRGVASKGKTGWAKLSLQFQDVTGEKKRFFTLAAEEVIVIVSKGTYISCSGALH
jgi:hypothetical protein